MLVPERSRRGAAALWSLYSTKPDRRDLGATELVAILRKDGREVPANITLTPVLDLSDTRIIAFIQRASALQARRRDIAIAAAVDKYQALFEATAEALLVVGQDGRYVDANAAMCELTGYTWLELRAMHLGDLAGGPPERRQDVFERMSRRERWRLDLDIARKDGRRVPVETIGEPVDLPGGSAYLLSARDISDRRAHERLQRDLLAMVVT
jgi:PAS domain S-box-containing protein